MESALHCVANPKGATSSILILKIEWKIIVFLMDCTSEKLNINVFCSINWTEFAKTRRGQAIIAYPLSNLQPKVSVTRLGDLLDFSKPSATINLPKSPTFLDNLRKGAKIFNFWNKIIFGQLLSTFFNFFTGHTDSKHVV